MQKYSNVPILIFLFWLALMAVVFRITMINIDMKLHDIHWGEVASDLSMGLLSFVGIGESEPDAGELVSKEFAGSAAVRSMQSRKNEFDEMVRKKEAELYLTDESAKVSAAKPDSVGADESAAGSDSVKKEHKEVASGEKPRDNSGRSYLLQCGAYAGGAGVAKAKDAVAALGFPVFIKESRSSRSGKTVWHRVLVGPFGSQEEQNAAYRKMAEKNIACYRIQR